MGNDLVHEIKNGVSKSDIEGAIKIFTDRLEWASLTDADTTTVKFTDLKRLFILIKDLKVSSEVKDKLYVRLVLNDDSNITLKFRTDDFENDVENRNKFKTLVAKLMTVSKNASGEKGELSIQQKNELLTTNNELYNLYKELVGNSYMLSSEFWTSPLVLRDFKINENTTVLKISKPAIPSQFWSSMVPVSVGCNEISLNLTSEYISAIFLAYPKGFSIFTQLKKNLMKWFPPRLAKQNFGRSFSKPSIFTGNARILLKKRVICLLKSFWRRMSILKRLKSI